MSRPLTFKRMDGDVRLNKEMREIRNRERDKTGKSKFSASQLGLFDLKVEKALICIAMTFNRLWDKTKRTP